MQQPTMDHLEIMLRRRQQALWLQIIKTFEVEDSLNIQVQKWIREGKISERAYDISRKKCIRKN
jgi:hypothetical protein